MLISIYLIGSIARFNFNNTLLPVLGNICIVLAVSLASIENVIIKATQDNIQRILVLKNNSFDKLENKNIISYDDDYYIKRKR